MFNMVTLDACTMVSQNMMNRVDKRLRQIMCADEPFGGTIMVMHGDPAQIIVVGANILLVDSRNNIKGTQS